MNKIKLFGLALTLEVMAEEIDYVAAKIGNILAFSPVGLGIVCFTIIALAGLFVWSRQRSTV